MVKMGMTQQATKVPILDINLAAFLLLKGQHPKLVNQGGRVVFLFDADETFTRLSEAYNRNEAVGVADYATMLRALRSRMIQARGPR
jgi:hypothetical protein